MKSRASPNDLVKVAVGSVTNRTLPGSDSLEAFIIQRARDSKIDVVGRLEWIEDAFEMIQNARKSLNETICKS